MTDIQDPLEHLARKARLESIPEIQVTARVIQRLSAQPTPWERVLARFAAISLAPAALSLAVSLPLIQQATDPLGRLFWLIPGILF